MFVRDDLYKYLQDGHLRFDQHSCDDVDLYKDFWSLIVDNFYGGDVDNRWITIISMFEAQSDI